MVAGALPPTPPARKLAARCGSRGASNGDCGAVSIGHGSRGPSYIPTTAANHDGGGGGACGAELLKGALAGRGEGSIE